MKNTLFLLLYISSYNTEEQNLADSIIHDQIRVLNEDYGRLNADSVNLRSDFFPHVGNANIEFRLADFDPDGKATNGITRTETNHTTFLNPMDLLSGSMASVERVKSTEDGGIDPWDQSRYMNIWVCNMAINLFGSEIPALLGYATPPSGLDNWPPGSTGGMSDGVVVQFHAFGSNNPNELLLQETLVTVKGRTATHEVGHYLGLRHIWGDGDCTEEDGIDDTPNAEDASGTDCDKSKNTCVDDIDGVDLPDMVENFMDYSAEDCQNTFTAGQVSLMRSVLENQRYDLVNNNSAVSIIKEELAEISLYPNPTQDFVTIVANKKIQGEILILDLNGRIVQNEWINNTRKTIDIQNLDSGIYHIVMKENSGTIKFVKM